MDLKQFFSDNDQFVHLCLQAYMITNEKFYWYPWA